MFEIDNVLSWKFADHLQKGSRKVFPIGLSATQKLYFMFTEHIVSPRTIRRISPKNYGARRAGGSHRKKGENLGTCKGKLQENGLSISYFLENMELKERWLCIIQRTSQISQIIHGKDLMDIPTTIPQLRSTKTISNNLNSSIHPHLPTYTFMCIVLPHLKWFTHICFQLPVSAFIHPHLPSSTFICIHSHPVAFSYLYPLSYSPTCLRLPSSALILPHLHWFTPGCLQLPLSAFIHPHLPSFTFIRIDSPTFTFIHSQLP